MHLQVEILLPGLDDAPLKRAAAVVKGVTLTRCLVESPANICTPQHLADAAKAIADSAPDCMKLEVRSCSSSKILGLPAFATGRAQGVMLTCCLVESPGNICTPQHLADAAKAIADSIADCAPDCMKLEVRSCSSSKILGLPAFVTGRAQGVTLTRCLVESPGNICKPQHFADAAKAIADSIADSAPDCMKLEVRSWSSSPDWCASVWPRFGRSSLMHCLVGLTANICTPLHLAEAAKAIADSAPDCMKLEVRDCSPRGVKLCQSCRPSTDHVHMQVYLQIQVQKAVSTQG